MPECYLNVLPFLFAVFAKETLGVTVQTGLYSQVELTGENFDQQTCDSITEVEWTYLKKRCLCLKFFKNGTPKSYSKCCGGAHFYLHNNSLILENVTAHVEGVFWETIVTENGSIKRFNFTLNIVYPPNATGILISWSSNNTSVSLTCEVNNNFTDIMWKKEDSSILEDNRHLFSKNNQTLHISNIVSSDYRKYSCVATNAYGQSETQIYITSEERSTHGENTTQDHDPISKHQTVPILFLRGLTFISILALCIIVLYGINKYRYTQFSMFSVLFLRRTQDRKTRGGVDTDLGNDQEVPGTLEMIAAAQMNSPHRVL